VAAAAAASAEVQSVWELTAATDGVVVVSLADSERPLKSAPADFDERQASVQEPVSEGSGFVQKEPETSLATA